MLKLSGEALLGEDRDSIDPQSVAKICERIKQVKSLGIDLLIVIGGGNIIRGIHASEQGLERTTADYMGMLATVINSLALQNGLEKIGVDTRVLTAIDMNKVAEPYIRRRALRHLEKGRVVIFAGGTGNPYFSTDTASVLRAVELNADILFKATKVDGIYDDDPLKNKNAKKFDELTYIEALKRNLKIMDATALSLCMDNNLPILVFNLWEAENLTKACKGKNVGTIVTGE